MRVAIIGTGAAAFGVVKGLLASNEHIKIFIYDVGQQLPGTGITTAASMHQVQSYYDSLYAKIKQKNGLQFPPSKTHFGETLTQYKIGTSKRCFQSNYLGGLTNVWGATMLPFNNTDLSTWPISQDELEPYYQLIMNSVGVSGKNDALSNRFGVEFSNKPEIKVLNSFSLLNKSINSSSHSQKYQFSAGVNRIAVQTDIESADNCSYCGECFAGCYKNAIFSTSRYFHSLIDSGRITYIRGKVTRFCSKSLKLQVARQGIEENTASFDKIYICAGCIETTRIVMNSKTTLNSLSIQDNAIFQFPIVNLNASDPTDKNNTEYLALANSIITGKSQYSHSLFDVQIQVYPNFDYLWRLACPETLWRLLKRFAPSLRGKLLWGRLYLHGQDSYRYTIRRTDQTYTINLDKSPVTQIANDVIREFRHALKRSGFYIPYSPPVLAKTSNHLAGPLAMTNNTLGITPDGKLQEGVYVCDSSIFPDSPATSPTFTIMANAFRIAEKSIKCKDAQ